MAWHILLEKARRSPHRSCPDLPISAHYDVISGWWRLEGEGGGPPFPRPTSKKSDIETGEDMKGE
jgi:hypothetical protein